MFAEFMVRSCIYKQSAETETKVDAINKSTLKSQTENIQNKDKLQGGSGDYRNKMRLKLSPSPREMAAMNN